jgi:protein TonB
MSAVADIAPDRHLPERPSSSAPAEAPSEASPMEAVRWIACIVIAAALHGIVAYYLLERLQETAADSGIEPQVVMLDLPESLAPLLAPPLELPPGPIMEPEVVETATPKEEVTKPPEPMEEVAPPAPEPPKPEPERAEVVLPRPEPPPKTEQEPPPPAPPPSAPQAARAPPPSVLRWQSLLARRIERFKQYPQAALARRTEGSVATVEFTIDHGGHLLQSRIVQSSGSAALDQETLDVLARAQPFPRPPAEMTDDELRFVMPLNFVNRR